MKIRLDTADADMVHTAEIPPFETGAPKVILWGARTFLHVGAEQQGSDQANRIERYQEVFCYALTD